MNRTSNSDLARIVRTAIRRLAVCPTHDIRRDGAACSLCVIEGVARRRGRNVQFHSIEQIMNAWPGGRL